MALVSNTQTAIAPAEFLRSPPGPDTYFLLNPTTTHKHIHPEYLESGPYGSIPKLATKVVRDGMKNTPTATRVLRLKGGQLPMPMNTFNNPFTALKGRGTTYNSAALRGLGSYNLAALKGLGSYNLAALKGLGSYNLAALRGMGSYNNAALRGLGSYNLAALRGLGGKKRRGRSYTAELRGCGLGEIFNSMLTNISGTAMKTIGQLAKRLEVKITDLLKDPDRLLELLKKYAPRAANSVRRFLNRFIRKRKSNNIPTPTVERPNPETQTTPPQPSEETKAAREQMWEEMQNERASQYI